MSAPVHPRDVDALKARLGPAVLAAAATLRSPEAKALARRWSDYCAHRATWATAPTELELGRDFEAQLALLQGPGTRGGSHVVGSILGFGGAFVLWRLLTAYSEMLARTFDRPVSGPLLMVGAPLALASLTLLACYLPARRATRIEPIAALRQE